MDTEDHFDSDHAFQSFNRLFESFTRFKDLVITFNKLSDNFEVLTNICIENFAVYGTNMPKYAGSLFQEWFNYLIAIIDEYHLVDSGAVSRKYHLESHWRVMDFEDTHDRDYESFKLERRYPHLFRFRTISCSSVGILGLLGTLKVNGL